MRRRDLVDPGFPTLLRELRVTRGLSLRALANRTHISKSTLSALENGQTQPTPEYARALDQALRADGALADLVSTSYVAAGDPVGDGTWTVAEVVNRLRAGDVPPSVIEALHATVFDLCCDYGWGDARTLRRDGLMWLREIESLLRRPVGLGAHRELLTAAGWLALLVGCVEYDLGMSTAAEASRRAALGLAAEAGHTEIAAWASEMAAWFALTQERYEDALAAVEGGMSDARGHAVSVQLVAQSAKVLARMGDRAGVLDALERGRRLLDGCPPPARPDHHFTVDPDKWDFYAMDAYRLVGDDERARHHAEQVLILGTAPDGSECAPMRMAEARLTLSTVAARAGAWDDAVTIALTAFQARRRSLPSLLMVAGEVDRELQRRAPRGRPVTELRDALHEVSKELPRRSQD